jgi:flagellar assembly protein FliH
MSPEPAYVAGQVAADRLYWPRPEMIAAGGEFARPHRMPETDGAHHPADLREAPLPPVIAERVSAIERDAYARGFAEGQQAGETAATARTDAMLRRLEKTIEEIAALRGAMLQRTERDIVRLALAIAERVIHREVATHHDLLVGMARVAIDRLGEHPAATIHLHPSDHDAVTHGDASRPGSGITLVADHQVARGACLVRSAFGTIDLGLDSQMREIARGLLGDEPTTLPGGDADGGSR